jgi:hypothetical protein
MEPRFTTFEDWISRVDRILSRLYGITSEDLPDQCYKDWYEDGATPAQAARRAKNSDDE